MKSSAKSINLTSLDDLFSTEESRTEESCEKVVRIPLSELHPFPNHPFHVRDDEAMQNTVDSIKEYGVLTPGIVRPRENGGYEIVAGHRRKHGSELAGLTDMPCIVREMDDDTATILMVDTGICAKPILRATAPTSTPRLPLVNSSMSIAQRLKPPPEAVLTLSFLNLPQTRVRQKLSKPKTL